MLCISHLFTNRGNSRLMFCVLAIVLPDPLSVSCRSLKLPHFQLFLKNACASFTYSILSCTAIYPLINLIQSITELIQPWSGGTTFRPKIFDYVLIILCSKHLPVCPQGYLLMYPMSPPSSTKELNTLYIELKLNTNTL